LQSAREIQPEVGEEPIDAGEHEVPTEFCAGF